MVRVVMVYMWWRVTMVMVTVVTMDQVFPLVVHHICFMAQVRGSAVVTMSSFLHKERHTTVIHKHDSIVEPLYSGHYWGTKSCPL